jgi:hypothetical protein
MIILTAGKECSAVTSGILVGGMDAADEWRVTCLDSGVWAVWFKPDAAREVRHRLATSCKD